MNNNGPRTEGLMKIKHHLQDEHKEINNGRIVGEGQGLSEENESRINEDVDDGQMEAVQDKVQTQVVMQSSQQQHQRPLVRWERFLPLRSLKVLLVENDDSTRHVVSALLRNCGYEVTAAENGLQAWKILEDYTTHVDLILTEVVMPCLSGIGLLSKIMSHKTCKNIPVIMMSSYDSMNIVFKCLSKGAVDFLAKPIRKNELKNLWQHVWRKCHSCSGSGSGSESAVHTRTSTKLKSGDELDNDTGSNDEDDNRSIGLNLRDGSDDGSGTQSSWTKRAVEVDSPQPMSPWEQLADAPDSTCARVIHSRPEAFGNNWVPVEHEEHDDEFGMHGFASNNNILTSNSAISLLIFHFVLLHFNLANVVVGKDLKIREPRIPNLQLEDPSAKGLANLAGTNEDRISEIDSRKDDENLLKGRVELHSEKLNGELEDKASDLTGLTTKRTDPEMESMVFNIPNGTSKVSDMKDKAIFDIKETPSLELSLKRLKDVGDTGNSAPDRNVLRHSDLSAFSRYTSASTNQAPTGNVGSCPLGKSSEAAKTESKQIFQSSSNSTQPNQCSNGSSNNNDMGSTTNNVSTKQVPFDDKSPPKSVVKCLHPSSAFQPVQNSHIPHSQSRIQDKKDAAMTNMILAQTRGLNQQNGSTATLYASGTNMESDNGIAGKGEASGIIGFTNRSEIDPDRVALREAALNKFRQKRKERCFEKKVRYQSRKKLAEQRPRVRGQFVRQVVHEN
ncbi:two-component response regulator-like aprr7 [Quercus suber]|uniref:Two-component response regulator-like aprr7 n=1 Tax=Quercus suber TaxID=58331 RepID=A0AAW0J7D1_QUESU